MKYAVLAIAFFVITTLGSGCKIITNVQYNRIEREEKFDVIIVPGFPYEEEKNGVNLIHRVRIFWAAYLLHEGVADNIIFSGGAVHTPYVEAEIMAQYAKSLGIPDDKIFIESRAEHSTENLFYGYALAEELGFKRIAVATDPFQAQLIKRNTIQDKLPVEFIPAKAGWILRKNKYAHMSIQDPCIAYVEDFVPLVERLTKEERKLGTAGERFRNRYKISQVTPENLAQIEL